MKTLAIRLEDDTHAQLTILAKLNDLTITDVIRSAIEVHVANLVAQPDIAAKAEALTAEIEREAAEQRSAILALLGAKPAATPAQKSKS